MLTEAIIQTSTPTSLKLDGVSQDEILILESISGLSDVKVNLFTGEYASEGSYYQGRRAEPRAPIFNFRIQPNYEQNIMPNQIREMIYRMFLEPQRDSDQVQILLKDDELPDRYMIAYTETINADPFVKQMKAQVGMQTVDAYLRSAELTLETNPAGWYRKPLNYEGSADAGIVLTAEVRAETTPYVTFALDDEAMILEGPFKRGDSIIISTVKKDRYVVVNYEDRMDSLPPTSPWLTLKTNSTVLKAYGADEHDGAVAITEYSYRAAWWGI